jgi:N-acetylmuramoyl-L-alanine amidase
MSRVASRPRRPFDPRAGAWSAVLTGVLFGALSGLLGGCAAPTGVPAIDTRYQAQGQDSRVQFLILHYTDGNFTDSLRTLTEQKVSAHYLVSDATPPIVYRLVDEDRRAWHAGESSWQGQTMLNAASIGIEIVNAGGRPGADGSLTFTPFPDAQIDAVIALAKDIVARHRILPDRVLGHSDIAPQRKVDPGPAFPWRRLAEAGLIPWPDAARVAARRDIYEAALPDVAWFQSQLAGVGYSVPSSGELDAETRRVITAFQMKYRPARYDGEPDAETAALLQVLNQPALSR